MELTVKTLEEFLESEGKLTYSNVGTSMMPLLKQGRDLFTLEKRGDREIKKYDVVLFRRAKGQRVQYVLHRVVKAVPDDYTILGDNCTAKDFHVRDNDVLAVMTEYVRKGKLHTVEERGYKIYSRLVVAAYPARRVLGAVKGFVKTVFHRFGFGGY